MTGEFTAWLVPARPPLLGVDFVVVVDANDVRVASRPLPYGATGDGSRDAALHELGFRRTGQWTAVPGVSTGATVVRL